MTSLWRYVGLAVVIAIGTLGRLHAADSSTPAPLDAKPTPAQKRLLKQAQALFPFLDLRYLKGQGGAVTGPLVLPNDPQNGQEAATKNYVDNAVAAALSGRPASPLDGSQFWSLTGNTVDATNFLGTLNNQALRLVVFGQLALRFETSGILDTTPNMIGGDPGNTIGTTESGSVIAGGGLGGNPNTINGSFSFIGTGQNNTISTGGAVITGGANNKVSGTLSSIVGGSFNSVSGDAAFLGGGFQNQVTGLQAALVGGANNTAAGESSFIGGGTKNTASGALSAILGGDTNCTSGTANAIGGGVKNMTEGYASMVPGGIQNCAHGDASFAAGTMASARNNGEFVWADNNLFGPFPNAHETMFTPGANDFLVRALGGVVFVTGVDLAGNGSSGVRLAPGSGSWTSLSDRNTKANFERVDVQKVLKQLVDIPIQKWNYKTQAEDIRHIGPMSQDFHAAFTVGEDERGISVVDAEGVSMAAIQGLYQIVTAKQEELDRVKEKNTELEERLAKIEKLLAGSGR